MNMGRYRIGNDLAIVWSMKDGKGADFPLSDKEVHLYYTCERGRYEADCEIQGNVIAWTFLGKDQRALGNYTLTAEILQSDGKRTIKRDICKAFTLVGRECEESDSDGDAVIQEGGEIILATDLDIYRMSPVIPQIGENGNWFVDGVDTGSPSRGEKGDVVDAAYLDFFVDEDMNLNLTYIYGNKDMNLFFYLDDNGNLTLDN